MEFDYLLDKIGPFGRYQKMHWITLSLVIIPSGIQNLLNIYLMAVPDHWCHVTELANLSVARQRALTTPSGEYQPCTVLSLNYSQVYTAYLNNDSTLLVNRTETRLCTEWKYDLSVYGKTGVTKWDLVCSKGSLPATAQSIYMFGFLVGAVIFGYMSDRFGRKLSLYTSVVGVLVFALLSCLQQNLWAHVILRMLAGIAACGCITIPFVMVMEMVGPSHRLIPGLFTQIFFALGYILLALVASLAKDFVLTNAIMSAFPAVLLFYWWTEPESPRWLLAQGRVEEAKKILKKMTKVNRTNIDIDLLLSEYTEQQTKLCTEGKASPGKSSYNYTILDILRTPNMRRKSINVLYNWFVTSMVYYGLSMGVTDLGGDPYVNLCISGVTECAAVLLACVVLDRLGRRLCLGSVLVVGGLACLIYGVLPAEYEVISIVLAMIGKFGVSGSFAIIYVFSAELFPTVVRTIGVGAGSMSARVGGLVAPFVAELKIFWLPLPNFIFGFCALTAGLLSFLLPETLGEKLPDTLEEGELFGKDMKLLQCHSPPSRTRGEQDKDNRNMTV